MSIKIIKSLAAAGLCAVVAATSAVTAFAADKAYAIAEIGDMNISLPDNYTAVQRGAAQDDPYFSLFGADYSTLMSEFQTNNIYLQGMDNTASIAVTVTMTETPESQGIGSYSLLSTDQLREIAQNFLGTPEYTACRMDEAGHEITWLSFDTKVNGRAGYLANTVYNGKSINISMERMGTDVNNDDFTVFEHIFRGVSFGGMNFVFSLLRQYWMYIAIGAALIVLIIVLIIVISKVRRNKRQKRETVSDNDRVLEELADKYKRKSNAQPQIDQTAQPVQRSQQPVRSEEPQGKYSDAQLAEILGEEISGDFPEALPEMTGEEPTPEEQTTETQPVSEPQTIEPIDTAEETVQEASEAEELPTDDITDDDDDFFAGANFETDEAYEEIEAAPVLRAEEVFEDGQPVEEPVEETEAALEEVSVEETSEEVSEEVPEEETSEEESEEVPGEAPEEESEEVSGEAPQAQTAEEPQEEDGEPDELEEYMNDEELVRQEAKSNKFKDSSDFFDEAPKRSTGVIHSRDIAEAEEYDVIGEVEKRADEVEKGAPEPKKKEKKNKKKGGGWKKFTAGVRYFFTHCGYFITNVKREIKRSRAKKKRQKAEEERRRRARERAARQRAAQQNGELVQVRSRGERRPQPSGQRRPSPSANRRPSPSTAKRRPPQKRR